MTNAYECFRRSNEPVRRKNEQERYDFLTSTFDSYASLDAITKRWKYNFRLVVNGTEHEVCPHVYANCHGFSKTAFERFAQAKKAMKTDSDISHKPPKAPLDTDISQYSYNEMREILDKNVVGGVAGNSTLLIL